MLVNRTDKKTDFSEMKITKYFENDIHCVILSSNLNFLFGLVPKYNSSRNHISFFVKLYCFIWTVTHASCVLYYICDIYQKLVTDTFGTHRITEIVLRSADVLGFCLVPALGIFESLFRQSQSWCSLYEDLSKSYTTIELQGALKHKMITIYLFNFVLGHFIIISMILMLFLLNSPFESVILALIYIWETYSLFAFNLLMTTTAMFLLTRYKDLNTTFEELEKMIVENPFNIQYAMNHARKCEQICRTLAEIGEKFDSMFGRQFLYLTGYIMIDILDIFNTVILYFMEGRPSIPSYFYHELFYFFILIVTYGTIVFTCDFTKLQAKTFSKLCYKMQSKLQEKSPLRSEILILAKEADVLCPFFSAAGFVDFDRKVFFLIGNTVLVYLIILINFNSSVS